MANIYVGQMKDALKEYYNKQKKLNEQIAENNKRYSEEYATKENETVKQEQAKEYAYIQEQIKGIYNNVRDYLAVASFPNVEQLTADRLIFESGMDLPAETVKAYVERYTKPYNPTMLSFIQSWIDRNNTKEDSQMFGKYAGIKVITPKEQLNVYKQFGDSALRIAGNIYNDGNSSSTLAEINSYADETFSSRLYNIIGDGMSLSDYKTARVPESAKNTFNSVSLSD